MVNLGKLSAPVGVPVNDVRKLSQTEEQIDRLFRIIDYLNIKVSSLNDRLLPVLRMLPQREAVPAAGSPPASVTPLCDSLAEAVRKLNCINENLAETFDRIEL